MKRRSTRTTGRVGCQVKGNNPVSIIKDESRNGKNNPYYPIQWEEEGLAHVEHQVPCESASQRVWRRPDREDGTTEVRHRL